MLWHNSAQPFNFYPPHRMSTLLQSIRLKLLFNAFLAFSLFFALGVATSFAAANDYTVSGGNPGVLPTVGDAAVPLPGLTILDVGGDDFTTDPENIIITINTTDYNNVTFDTTVANTALTISGTCTYDAANSLTYSADGQEVTVPITDSVGNECASGQSIIISNGIC